MAPVEQLSEQQAAVKPVLLDEPPIDREIDVERSSREPLWWVLALLAAAAVARLTMQWNVALPACNFRRLTSLPCPLCGGTRAMRSLADLELGTAVQFNPLVVIAAFLIVGWFALWTVDHFVERPILPRLKTRLPRWPIWWIVGGLVLVNWFYLIRELR
ncbi:DUF2752 domain-containing protein [bacterium]|nr:DUF2752 domain-containing protein [bacterium]